MSTPGGVGGLRREPHPTRLAWEAPPTRPGGFVGVMVIQFFTLYEGGGCCRPHAVGWL